MRYSTLGYSLRIVYNIQNRYEAAYISEFFKMCGFFVVEQEVSSGAAEYERIMGNYRRFHHNLFLGIPRLDYETYFLEDCRRHPGIVCRLPANPSFLSDYRRKAFSNLEIHLTYIVTRVLNFESPGLADMVSVFVRSEYCRASYIKRYFCEAVPIEKKEELRRTFMQVISCLEQNERVNCDKTIYPYYLYAKFLCARKVNDICEALGMAYVYDLKQMIKGCLLILDFLPAFPGAYVLAASFCCRNAYFRASIVPLYEAALKQNEENPAFANVYYRFGHYYEKQRENMKRANANYKQASLIAPKYFRAVFKRGMRHLNKRKFSSAICAFSQVIETLDMKREYSMLFPVEYEYLCKCYVLIGMIYEEYWDDELRGRYYYRQAMGLVEYELKRSRFFHDFLGDENGIYLSYLEKRIALRRYFPYERVR